MDFNRLKLILLHRKRRFLSVLAAIVLFALLVSLLLPKQYLATTSVIIDQSSADPVTGLTIPVQLMAGYMATQVDVISSHNVARKVVEKLNLSHDDKILKDYADDNSSLNINDWTAKALLKKLDVKPAKESSLIQIDYTAKDPQMAANVANAFAEGYIQTIIELRAQSASLSADWYDMQINLLRKNLEKARSLLSSYQQEHGIVSADDKLDIENSRLAELSRQLVESQANTSELQARYDLSTSKIKQGGSLESLQEVLSNTFIQSLKSDLAKAEGDFAELSKKLDVNHPKYIQAKAEVDSLNKKLQSEIKMVSNDIASRVESANKRNKILTKSLAEQKAKVLELKKQHDEIALLNREMENAQMAFDAAMKRAIQTHMESEMSQTNIAVLNPAIKPEKPSKPKLLLNLVLAVFIGSLAGLGSVVMAETKDRRVRMVADLAEELELPVFAILNGKTKKLSETFSQNYQTYQPENRANG
jgi:polysaccharide biosynthesis transport protein